MLPCVQPMDRRKLGCWRHGSVRSDPMVPAGGLASDDAGSFKKSQAMPLNYLRGNRADDGKLKYPLQRNTGQVSSHAVMAVGVAITAAFPTLERFVARRGGMPLIDLALLSDRSFMRGLGAAFFFFFANQSFYLVMTLFMQRTLKIPPLHAGMVFVPAALAFVVASRNSAARARHRGTLVLIEGCTIQIAGLAALALTSAAIESQAALLLAL